jgi:hypothetical protein
MNQLSHGWLTRSTVAGCMALALLGTGCGKSDNGKGRSLGMPKVEPPVERNVPKGMQGAAVGLLDGAESPLQTLKSRFFALGPTSIFERLSKIDERLTELNARSEGMSDVPACLDAEPKLWDQPAELPSSEAFPIYLQCQEQLSGQLKLAFGAKDDFAYLVEIQNHDGSGMGPKVATLVRAKKDGSATEAWITMQYFDSSRTTAATDFFFLGLKADDASRGFEFSVGGSGPGIGVDCGVRVRSDGAHVYGAGIFASHGDRGVEDCSGGGTGSSSSGSPAVELCVDATNLQNADGASCSSINSFTLPSLTYQGLSASGKATSDAFVAGSFGDLGVFATAP